MPATDPTKLERLEMQLQDRVRGVLLLGHYIYTRARPALQEHMHPGQLEICYLVKGRQTYQVNGLDYRLNSGDIFMTLPDEQHSSGDSPEEKGELYWMVLELPRRLRGSSTFLGQPATEGRGIIQALENLPRRHFHGSLRMKEHLDAITRLHQATPGPLNTFALGNHVGAFLLEVIAHGHADGEATLEARHSRAKHGLAPVLQYIREHLDEPLPVPLLAQQAGLSVPRFKTRFRAEIGLPPGEYVLREKVRAAQQRLTTGRENVTQITFELGFSSSQYFATVFKRFTGQTPTQWMTRRGEPSPRAES